MLGFPTSTEHVQTLPDWWGSMSLSPQYFTEIHKSAPGLTIQTFGLGSDWSTSNPDLSECGEQKLVQHWLCLATTLRKTNIAPENRPFAKRKQSYSKHHFSGVNSLLVSGMVVTSISFVGTPSERLSTGGPLPTFRGYGLSARCQGSSGLLVPVKAGSLNDLALGVGEGEVKSGLGVVVVCCFLYVEHLGSFFFHRRVPVGWYIYIYIIYIYIYILYI